MDKETSDNLQYPVPEGKLEKPEPIVWHPAKGEPTQKQIDKVWEWCGFKYKEVLAYPHGHIVMRWVAPDGSKDFNYPPIDPNNLFKYAVPKLIRQGHDVDLCTDDGYYFARIRKTYALKWHINTIGYLDPALALFWAIWKVVHG